MRRLTALASDVEWLRKVASDIKWSKSTRNGARTLLTRLEASNA